MEKYYYKSPIGILEIICEDENLMSLKLVGKIGQSGKETPFVRRIMTQLEEYFSGKRESFDIKVNPTGTEFQRKVWAELLKIPYGTTKSYSDIAAAVGNKYAQRAVGSACNKNPVMIVIPCHRVIAKNGNSGGFAYGTKLKEKLLKLESLTDKIQN